MAEITESLPVELELALAYTPAPLRARLRAALALDHKLGRIVAATTEPMLGQMRLAWWRDTLSRPVEERPSGDEVLDAVGLHWKGLELPLVRLVDGWEVLVTTEELDTKAIEAFGEERGAFFESLHDGGQTDRIVSAAFRWAVADAAASVSDNKERTNLIEAGLGRRQGDGSIPRALRGLAVLEALALRALRAGGRPLMEGRSASLVALRAGILGR